MNKLPARTGWAWLKQGAALFGKQPAGLTIVLFANIVIAIAFSAVPLLGPVLGVVLTPALSMAFMQACLMIDNGERVTPRVLLTGFRKPVIGALIKLGLVYLVVSLLLLAIAHLLVDETLLEQMAKRQLDPATLAAHVPELIGTLVFFLLEMATLISLAFTAPLTFWHRMGPGKATFYSFFAVVKRARVFIVMLAAWFGLYFGIGFIVTEVFGPVSGIASAILMWLIFVFVVLLQCAIYVGYRDIFGKPVEPVAHQPA